MSSAARRFRIAFSFAGEKREFVAKVAALLAEGFGEDAILYDKYHEAEFARHDLGIYLPKLYSEQSDLIVPVLCGDYDHKRWTGWEWVHIYSLLTKKDGHRVMPCRFDHASADGLTPVGGFIELDDKTPEASAKLILERLALNESENRNHYLDQPSFANLKQHLAKQEETDASGTDRAVSEDPASILKLLHDHMAAVQALWAGRLTCAVPREPIPEASQLFGRGDDLTKLRALLRSHRRVAVTGPGGLGKTALCAALVKRLEAEAADEGRALLHAGLFAHDFYKRPSLADFVSGILEQAGLVCEEATQQPALAALVLRRPGVMLYIEGAEKLTEAAALLEFLDDRTRLILTTRDPRQAETLAEHPLEPLEFDDAAQAMHHYAVTSKTRRKRAGPWPHGREKPGWELLASKLGGHPLACRLAGELCAVHSLDPTALHEKLGKEGLLPLLRGEDSKKNLHILFRQSALAVQDLSPGGGDNPSPALTAWHGLTLGGTSPVPISILQAFGVADQKDLALLVELGLAWSTSVVAEQAGAQEPAYALTHALLGEWARTGLAEFGCPAERLRVPAMQWGEEFLGRVQHHARVPGGPERYLVVVPVAEALLREVEALPDLKPGALYNFYYLPARMHERHARHLAAEALYRRGWEKMEQSAGPDAPPTAAALNNLALLLQATNRLAEAEPLLRRALAIDEASFGNDHPEVARDINNLAQLLKATNRLAEAEPLMRRALAICEVSFGSNHPHVATALTNLAQLLQDTNRLAEAEPLMRRALAIDEASFGSDHPNVATGLNNLAGLIEVTNRLTEAEPLMRRALAIDETSFGSDHPNVAIRLNNLAQFLGATNRQVEAEPLMRRALAIHEASFGSDHPSVSATLNNLASLLHATNRLAEAEPLMRRALAIDEASFGSDHPYVAIDINNLAWLLKDTNRLAEAEPLMRRALAINEASFGSDHPDVAIRLNNLALLLQATHRLAEAEPLMRRGVKILVAFAAGTGHPHPQLVTVANNYAGLLMEMGETQKQAREKVNAILAPVLDKLRPS
jgi:tetratricopeptide (TPR) repeat protein